MLMKILGIIWAITGLIGFLFPDFCRRTVEKKGMKKIRRILFGIALFLSIALIGAAWELEGMLKWILMIVGVIGVFKAMALIKGKLGERLVQWLTTLSPMTFRMIALVHIAFGVCLYLIGSGIINV